MTHPADEKVEWTRSQDARIAVPKETVEHPIQGDENRWVTQIPYTDKKEAVKHPQHYNTGKYEVIDVIEDWKLGFNDGNAVKYIGRHRHKVSPKEDLKKALWYIARELVSMHAVSPDELATIVQTVRK